jgi:PAS domain S-box-containing protein
LQDINLIDFICLHSAFNFEVILMKIRSPARKFVLNRIPHQTPEWISKGYTLFFILSIVIVFGGFALIPSIISAIQEEKWISFSALSGAYMVVLFIFFKKNLSYYMRSYILCFSIAVAGYVSISSIGLISSARLWFLCSAVLACLLIGGKSAFAVFLISFIVFVGFGHKTGFAIKLPSEPDHIVWIITSTTFVLVNILVVGATYLIVSGLKKAETSLRKSEERFRLFAELAPVGIILSDRQENTLYVSPKFTELFGYTMADIPSVNQWWTLAYPDEELRTRIRKKWKAAIDEGTKIHNEIKPMEFLVTCRDGTIRQIEFRIRAADDLNVIVFSDITDRKRAEEELNIAHERILTILDSIDSTVYVADMDTYEILFMNQKMITDFGGDKTGEICYSAFRKNSEPCEWCTNDQLVDKHGNPAGVHVWHDKNPVTGRYYSNHDRAIEWTDGRLVRMQIAADITELKKMETQLLQAQKMESVGRLAGGVAHDFNNMLGVILGHVEFAMEKAEQDHELHADLKEIQTAATRSADITKQLLAFARKQTISPRQLDLNHTVESMLNMLRRLIGEDIDLVWKPSAHLWPVKIDPSQIDQILANLCINARDAISGVGKLTIETGRKSFDEEYCSEHPGFIPGDFVLLAVSDNGCGMDRETLDNLFEPFFTTKEMGKGTGLGLATIYGIVKQNNGFINVYSEHDRGSSFKIYLPRAFADKDTDKAAPEKNEAAGGTETILLVEDEPAILNMTRMMLERKGYSVLSAASPAKAINMAKAHTDKIHLIMTDVVMPGMNGRDLARHLKPLYPDIKLLFMSGYTANVIAHHGVLDEGVYFIQKPFSMKDLAEKVRVVLDGEINTTAQH